MADEKIKFRLAMKELFSIVENILYFKINNHWIFCQNYKNKKLTIKNILKVS